MSVLDYCPASSRRRRQPGGRGARKKECLNLTNKAIMLLKTKDRENEQSQTKPIIRGAFGAAIPARGMALLGVRRLVAALLRSFRKGGQRPPLPAFSARVQPHAEASFRVERREQAPALQMFVGRRRALPSRRRPETAPTPKPRLPPISRPLFPVESNFLSGSHSILGKGDSRPSVLPLQW